jgi:hypothetical protein
MHFKIGQCWRGPSSIGQPSQPPHDGHGALPRLLPVQLLQLDLLPEPLRGAHPVAVQRPHLQVLRALFPGQRDPSRRAGGKWRGLAGADVMITVFAKISAKQIGVFLNSLCYDRNNENIFYHSIGPWSIR